MWTPVGSIVGYERACGFSPSNPREEPNESNKHRIILLGSFLPYAFPS